jgi:hypothetical protein
LTPFYVKNSNNYKITLCMFLKGIFLRNALKNPHQKQKNNKYIYTHIYMHLNKVLQKIRQHNHLRQLQNINC